MIITKKNKTTREKHKQQNHLLPLPKSIFNDIIHAVHYFTRREVITMRAPVFDREQVSRMGALVEAALFKESNRSDEVNLLSYAKEFIDVRRVCLSGKGDNEKLMNNLKEKEKLLNKKVIDVDALNMWLRGSRGSEKDALAKNEEEILYERLEDKLN